MRSVSSRVNSGPNSSDGLRFALLFPPALEPESKNSSGDPSDDRASRLQVVYLTTLGYV